MNPIRELLRSICIGFTPYSMHRTQHVKLQENNFKTSKCVGDIKVSGHEFQKY